MHRQKQTVSLANSLDKDNHLSDLAIAKATACLHDFNRSQIYLRVLFV